MGSLWIGAVKIKFKTETGLENFPADKNLLRPISTINSKLFLEHKWKLIMFFSL